MASDFQLLASIAATTLSEHRDRYAFRLVFCAFSCIFPGIPVSLYGFWFPTHTSVAAARGANVSVITTDADVFRLPLHCRSTAARLPHDCRTTAAVFHEHFCNWEKSLFSSNRIVSRRSQF